MIIFAIFFIPLVIALGVCIFLSIIDPSLFENIKYIRVKTYSEMILKLTHEKEARRRSWPKYSHIYIGLNDKLYYYSYLLGCNPWQPNNEELNATDWEIKCQKITHKNK